jgi:hypothetical protein
MAKPDRYAAAGAAREKLNSRRISGTACNVVGLNCLYCLTRFSGCLYFTYRHGKPYAAGVAARLIVLPVVPDLFLTASATTPGAGPSWEVRHTGRNEREQILVAPFTNS